MGSEYVTGLLQDGYGPVNFTCVGRTLDLTKDINDYMVDSFLIEGCLSLDILPKCSLRVPHHLKIATY